MANGWCRQWENGNVARGEAMARGMVKISYGRCRWVVAAGRRPNDGPTKDPLVNAKKSVGGGKKSS